MDLAEAGALLTYAASCDRRIGTPGKQDAIRWADLLEGMTFERCKAAIRKHYQESDEVIMPAHIRRLARTTTDGDAPASAMMTPPGEILCGDCGRVHRPDESCAELVARPWPRPIASTVKALTAEPEPSAAQERALARARAERGNIPWSPPREPAAEDPRERPVEERDYQYQPGAITEQDLPGDAPAMRCACGAVFLDYPAGRTAHVKVFSHEPRPQRQAPQRQDSEAATSGG